MILEINKTGEFFLEGKLDSTLFGKQIGVMIEVGTPMEYAESCAREANQLPAELIGSICRRVKDYYCFMLEEWDEEFAEQIRETVPPAVEGRDILAYIEEPTLVVNRPEGEGIGYSVSGICPWEPEHGVDIIVKDKALLYVGPQNCLGPWANEDEYRVIF